MDEVTSSVDAVVVVYVVDAVEFFAVDVVVFVYVSDLLASARQNNFTPIKCQPGREKKRGEI